ncbi:ABC transporter permease [Leifsonia sp. EB34]|uniref:ABC transporter permease n=1 Tax=Leifsonia sp. EB34 TaxID=3156303 RepID=UPI003511B9CE
MTTTPQADGVITAPAPRAAAGRPAAKQYLGVIVAVVVVVILLVLGALTAPNFLTVSNLLNVLRAASITGIVALGLTFVTISGHYFSLSVLQTAVLSSVVYAATASVAGFWGGLAAMVVTALVVGAVQGLVISVGGNPVVVTFAAGAAILGFVLWVTDSTRVLLHAPADSLAVQIGGATPLGIPMATWTFVVLAVVSHLVLQKTTLGRRTILVGANKATARAVGVNVRLVIVAAFVISALAAGIAGMLSAAEFGVADTAQFPNLDIDAVAAVLVGGTAIKGGQGSALQTVVGAIFISLLRNYLQIMGLSTGIQLLCVGGAVVLAVAGYTLMKGRGK